MFPVMRSASRLNGYLFATLTGIMLVLSVPQLFRFADLEPNKSELYLNGQLSRKFEQHYDRAFFLRDPSITFWANVQYTLFHEGHSGVVIGKEDWLFTNQELLPRPDISDALEKVITRIRGVADTLKKRQQTLVLIPVPMKADVYREYLPFAPDPEILSLYDRFVQQLTQSGIATVDTRPALLSGKSVGEVFLRRDTHWTPLGAKRVAYQVAETFPALKGTQPYRTRKVGRQHYASDLRNYIRFSEALQPRLHATEEIDRYETVKVLDQGSLMPVALFGDQEDFYVLVGTSYTDIDAWNFTGFLQQALRKDIVPYAVQAEGPWKAMDGYLARSVEEGTTAPVVFWEFPVRSLLVDEQAAKPWEMLDLQFRAPEDTANGPGTTPDLNASDKDKTDHLISEGRP